jgi:hypothetical protein
MPKFGFDRLLAASPLTMLLLTVTPAVAQPSPTAKLSVVPAVQGVLDAFASRPIVALGEEHGLAQELDFYSAVVRDPRFAAEVGNVVVESGSATQQATIDRYLAGETVPYAELRKVWSDTVEGAWAYLGNINLFAQVRATNLSLPPERRIRVWLGDPPIDWSKIHTKVDLAPYEARRNAYPAELIRREILAKGKKALVIYGGGHFFRQRDFVNKGATVDPRSETALRALFRDFAADATDYTTMTPSTADRVRERTPGWRVDLASYGDLKSIGYEGRNGAGDIFLLQFSKTKIWVAIRLDAQGRIDNLGLGNPGAGEDPSITDRLETVFPASVFTIVPDLFSGDKACIKQLERVHTAWTAPALVQPVRGLAEEMMAAGCDTGAARGAEGLLYLGSPSGLTMSAMPPDIYLDEAFRREESRRNSIWSEPLPRAPDMRDYPSAAKNLFP